MFNSNSVSISVSDDESDELGRMRVRVRRKRKKLGHRFKNEFFRRVVRSLVKYWSLLILLPAIGLLLYEAWSIGWKSPQLNNKSEKPSLVHSELNASSEKKSEGNLNRLDPITRVIHGVRERCLQILPPEELEHLEIPVREAATSPVKKLLYRAENDGPLLGGYNTRSEEHTEATRFNLFTGNQTLDQRREMFQVNGTVSINCGFYSESGGFKISNEDKNYMQSCDIVVSTCAFGGGGDLYQPIGMSKASLQKNMELAVAFMTRQRPLSRKTRPNRKKLRYSWLGTVMVDCQKTRGSMERKTTLIEPTSGNMGITMAFMASMKRYKMVLTMLPLELS
ncbi:uncharacterized protein LOC133714248 isoform X4 [Rosa rugosa]|uniref:uncharacterized protein LOC133714248 isoform X4 n=1 Tax=Rosa rugosa TaxID=74645 RepID=UPI002B4139E4|nr:uncharacterized protein LOC133714248 isoform X4 [Rosa rugosa]